MDEQESKNPCMLLLNWSLQGLQGDFGAIIKGVVFIGIAEHSSARLLWQWYQHTRAKAHWRAKCGTFSLNKKRTHLVIRWLPFIIVGVAGLLKAFHASRDRRLGGDLKEKKTITLRVTFPLPLPCKSKLLTAGKTKKPPCLMAWWPFLFCRHFCTKFEPSSRERKSDPFGRWRYWVDR